MWGQFFSQSMTATPSSYRHPHRAPRNSVRLWNQVDMVTKLFTLWCESLIKAFPICLNCERGGCKMVDSYILFQKWAGLAVAPIWLRWSVCHIVEVLLSPCFPWGQTPYSGCPFTVLYCIWKIYCEGMTLLNLMVTFSSRLDLGDMERWVDPHTGRELKADGTGVN